jgi:hypothetical protein
MNFIFFGLDGVDWELVEKWGSFDWCPVRQKLTQDLPAINKAAGLYSPFVWGSIFRGHTNHKFRDIQIYAAEEVREDEDEYIWNDGTLSGAYINAIVCEGHLTWIPYEMQRIVNFQTSIQHLFELSMLIKKAAESRFNNIYVTASNADLFSHTLSGIDVFQNQQYSRNPNRYKCPECGKLTDTPPKLQRAFDSLKNRITTIDAARKKEKMWAIYTHLELWMNIIIDVFKPDKWVAVSDHGWDQSIKMSEEDAFGVANHSTRSILLSNMPEFAKIHTMSDFITNWRGMVKENIKTLDLIYNANIYKSADELKVMKRLEDLGYVG